MKWFIKCFKQYADFEGRARRKEYWWFWLIYLIVTVALMIGWLAPIVKMAATTSSADELDEMVLYGSMLDNLANPFLIIWLLFYLATLIPGIAVSVRRLHDIGKSGWWYFLPLGTSLLNSIAELLGESQMGLTFILMLISLGAGILFLVWMFTDSQYGPNQWGPNPKGEGNPTEEQNTLEP